MSATEGSHIVEFPIEKGQNEGQAIQVLPIGEFSSLRNARFRKNNLLGKRNGYTSKSSLDSEGLALGNGNGRLSCLGPFFCAVDDVFYRRDTIADNWVAKPSIGVLGGSRSLWNKFPEFSPGPIIDPPVQESLETTAPPPNSGMTTGMGYIWTAEGRIAGGSWFVYVHAMSPDTGEVVHRYVVPLSGVTTSDTPGVQLLSMPTPEAIVLLTDRFTATVKTSVEIYSLTSLDLGFDLAAASPFACIESAANYYPTSNDKVLFAYVLTASPTTVRAGTLDPVTGAVVQLASATTVGNKDELSIFGQAAGGVCVGYYNLGSSTVNVLVYDAAFAATGSFDVSASIPTALPPIMFAERSAMSTYKLTVVTASSGRETFVLDFDANGSVTTVVMRQRNCRPLSQPFSIGTTEVFIWLRYESGEGLGVATLVRIPHDQEFSGGAASLPGVFPVQATVDDRDVALPLSIGHAGPPFPTPRVMSNGYNALINYTRASFVSASATHYMRSVMVVPVRHLSEGVRHALSCVVPCRGRQFIAGAQPQWVDGSVSTYEAGFIQAPVSIASPTESGGGSLTATSAYSYTVVFESTSSGMLDRSAPAVPVSLTLTGVNNRITTRWTTMELGARGQVTGKIYRTSANGSVFYFVNKFDASPGSGTLGYFDFVDGAADADIIQNEALYINIGQELPTANFPACRFANVGGSRLWVGGGFTGNIVTASKRFVPYIAPEFADDDAFRVSLPAECTGGAWCDSQVLFTQEGIYVVSGEGPDGAGEGFFTTSRLPFNIGCIDWRSVGTCDMGVFFQSSRGLHLLPRGFGQPIPMDQVLDTLTTYPIITSRSDYSSRGGADTSEQVIQWTAVADEEASSGVVITFDSAYKAFYVDTCNADFPAVFQTGWDGDAVQSPRVMTVGPNGASRWHPFRVRDTGFDDQGLAIDFSAITGDVRPWGTFGHGVIERLGLLGVMRSACSLLVTKTTDKGTRAADPRVYTAAAPDPLAGAEFYLAIELGSVEQKDVTRLRVQISETSAVEGIALVAMIIEVGDTRQNYKLLRIADRIQ